MTLFTNISNSTIQSDLIQATTIKRPHQKKANIYQNRFVSNQEFKCDCFFLLYLTFHLFSKYVSHFASSKKQLKHITKHNKYTEKQDIIKKLPIVVTNNIQITIGNSYGFLIRNSCKALTTLSNSFLLRKLFSFTLKN